MAKIEFLILFSIALFIGSSTAAQCGRQAGNALCKNGLCCSGDGFCGSTDPYCGPGCQSQCSGSPPSPPDGHDVGSIITEDLFYQMLKHWNDPSCPSNGFYIYGTFIAAANAPVASGFGTTGDINTRKRELAAFFAQTSHETAGARSTAPGGPFEWGYCYINQTDTSGTYCTSPAFPCAAGRKYYGRGPMQLTNNCNYGLAAKKLGLDLSYNPDLVATDAEISFETAIWFWMTPQKNKPSSHNVMIGQWTPSDADKAAGRLPGYGVITNIINGGLECGIGQDIRVANRIGYYETYCDMLGVSYGSNLDCYHQRPFGEVSLCD